MCLDNPPICTIVPDNQVERYGKLRETFASKFGCQPEFFARAPGRVNIIGEHIDYCGYGVLPMAIEQDIVIAASTNDSGSLHLHNASSKYGSFSCPVHDFSIDKSNPQWYHYFLCGFRGIIEHFGVHAPPGMNLLLDGNIPASSGLSSSSALVCCAALTTLYTIKQELTKLKLAELCAQCEKYIGTEGGGMDQSISFLAQPGTAKMINFHPIRASDVRLPDGAVFVIANSCVTLNKAATNQFNTRVVECRLAAQVVAKKEGIPWREIRRLGELHTRMGNSLTDMIKLVKSQLHSEAYTKEEICSFLGVSDSELNNTSLSQNTLDVMSFKLFDRALHVYTEASRVAQFKEICDSESDDIPQKLGSLMNDSHTSCSENYECSCVELDKLVATCRKAGAYGSRLTGAGWGGCCVSLVPSTRLQTFLKQVEEEFYNSNKERLKLKATSLFPTSPGGGAAIYVTKSP